MFALLCVNLSSMLSIFDLMLCVLVSLTCSDQAEARRQKVKQSRLRREERQKQKREELHKQLAKEDDASKTSK